MKTVSLQVSLESLTATEIAALQRIVAKACIDSNRSNILAAIVDAGVANAGDEYAEETNRVGDFFRGYAL
ncbi:MAG: hypothetical protein IAE79_05785 [Anaerolinea sp.]|nr:hypothetical protein [Anaerolinea sp.]